MKSTTTYTQSQSNIRKTWLLMGGFLIFVILIGWGVSWYFNNPAILYGAVLFSTFGNFFSFFFSDKVALSISGAKPADRSTENGTRIVRAVENMAITAGIKTPKAYIINDASMNAFATGRGPEHSAIAVSSGLLEKLDKNELEGVIAHEISHIKNRDILIMTVVVTLVGMVAVLSNLFMRGSLRKKEGGGKAQMIFFIVGIIFAILAPLIAKIIQLAVSRKREYLADASGAHLTRYPEGLATALEKIRDQAKPMKKASAATAHMFISSPFAEHGKKKVSFLEKIFSTHPPINERIKILREMDGNSNNEIKKDILK